MRLLTWNVASGDRAKRAALLAQIPADIVTLQEVPRPDASSDQHLWFGTNPNKGVSIQAFGDYRLKELPTRDEAPQYFIPVEVSGPQSFVLFAVWSQKEPHAYIEGVSRAVSTYAELIGSRQTVLLGDFNSNAIWNAEHPPEHNHASVTTTLAELGCVSVYHEHFGEPHGAESRPTYFHYWKEERPFHIDYTFIPKAWLPHVEGVSVSTFPECEGVSDHRPMVVSLRLPAAATEAQ